MSRKGLLPYYNAVCGSYRYIFSKFLIHIIPLLDQLQPLLQQQPLIEGDLNQEEIGSIVLHVVVFLPQMPQIVVLSMLVIHLKEKLVILVMFVCGIPI